MTSGSSSMRLGELLVSMGLLTQHHLWEAANLAVELGLPLGKVITMSGFVTEKQLQACLKAQSLLKDQLLTLETACAAVKLVSEKDVSLEQALRELSWNQKDPLPTNKLGELLLESGIIGKQQLDEALASAITTGLPLGRILVRTGNLPEALLCSCLNAQVLLRDGKITRQQAIQGLKSAYQRQLSLEQCLMEQGFYRPAQAKIKLGELFVFSGIIQEQDIMLSLEMGLIQKKPLGQVLVEAKLISQDILDTAVRLQEMVDNGTLTPLDSAEVLRQIQESNIPLSQAVAELGLLKPETHETIRLGELLKLAGFITESDIQEALALSLKNNSLIGKMLLITGLIDETTLHAALRCQFLLREGFLKEDQAIIALHYCQRMQCSFDDALEELGWTIPTRRSRSEKCLLP